MHMFSRVFETIEKFAGRCYRGFLKLFKTLAARVLTGQRPIEQEIRQRAWGWIGHTLRRPDGHVAKRAPEWNCHSYSQKRKFLHHSVNNRKK